VVAQLKAMAVASSAAMGFQRQQWSRQLGPILKLWEQLMGSHPGLRAPGRAPGGTESWGPVESFVALERSNAARLVSTIDGTLTRLSRVLRGADALSPAVQSAGAALMLDEVPSAWDALWEGPEAPLDYCRAVVSRAAAIESWLGKASSGQLLPPGGQGPPLDLSHLLNPVTFLNALRQTSARQLGTSVDNLKLVSCWEGGRLRSPVAAPIAGMLIQGATFDGVRLSATSGDAPTDATIPPATFAWIPKTEAHPYSNFATVPLYVTSDRSKLLAEVQMPVVSAEEQVQWTLAGVALFLCA
jgi:dynein heavy chain 2